MKIVWHMPTLRRTTCGLSRRAIELARRLALSGRDVTFVVDIEKTDISSASVEGLPLIHLSIPRISPWHWSLQARTRGRIAEEALREILGDPALAHDLFISCQPEMIAAYARQSERGPVLFVCGGTTLLHDEAERCVWTSLPIHRRWAYRIDQCLKHREEAAAFRGADAVVFDSRHTLTRAVSAYRLDEAQCHAIHGGVDSDQYAPPTPEQRLVARHSLGLAEGSLVIAWTGRFSPEKNVELLLRALPLCRRRVDAACMVGDGPQFEELRRLAGDLGLSSQVRFPGAVSDVRLFLHAADFFVFPSRGESFGGSLVEAMACGLPCIALRPDGRIVRTAGSEIIEHRRTGLLASPATPQGLAGAIDELSENNGLRQFLGEAGSRKARSQFTWNAAARELNHLISKLVRVPFASDIHSGSHAQPAAERQAGSDGGMCAPLGR